MEKFTDTWGAKQVRWASAEEIAAAQADGGHSPALPGKLEPERVGDSSPTHSNPQDAGAGYD